MKRVFSALAVIALAQGLALACSALTPTERTEVANTAATIEACQELGRACKLDGGSNCYDSAYGACMHEAGLR